MKRDAAMLGLRLSLFPCSLQMPVVNSDVMKVAAEKENRRRRELMLDATTTTATDHDVASELAKHVGTLRKISLIAEEFNQKTGEN